MRLKGIFNDPEDFIELTEWSNGEGYDISLSEKNMGHRQISLSRGTLDALIHVYTAPYEMKGKDK